MGQIFRKKSLDKLSSPEELDTLVQITTLRGWIALATVGFCLAVAVAWGIYGQVPYKINGRGILMTPKGLFTIEAAGAGRIDQLNVKIGQIIHKGEIVARITQSVEESEVGAAREEIRMLTHNYQAAQRNETHVLQKKRSAFESRKNEINLNISTNKAKISRLNKRIKDQVELLKKGLLTKHDVSATIESRDNARELILKSQNELKQLQVEIFQAEMQKKQRLKTIADELENAREKLNIKLADLKSISEISAAHDGILIELKVIKGDRVTANQLLMTLELTDQGSRDLISVQYFPAISAKEIIPGMTAQIAPGTVKVDQFGFALGKVTYVAEFPSTAEELNKILRNEILVKDILSQGDVLEVRVNLQHDPSTPSGYRWTSSKGPPIKLRIGTECFSSVIVKSLPPITLVIPMIKKFLLGSEVDNQSNI